MSLSSLCDNHQLLDFSSILGEYSNAHKILVFSPTASKSHMISQGRIADELAKAGHQVTNFEPDFLDLTDKFVPCKLCKRWPVTGLKNAEYKRIQSELSEHIFKESSIWSRIFNAETDPHQDEYNNLCEEIVSNSTLIAQLRAENFDAYFGEHVHLCGMGLAQLLGIRHKFWVASCTMGVSMRDTLGVPTPSSFLPFMAHLDSTPAPITQRLTNLLLHLVQLRDEYRDNYRTTQMYRKHFGPQFPDINEIARDSDVVFVSTDELLEIPAPTLSNIVHIGGLGTEHGDESGLDAKFGAEMEKGDGVILFSLGTIANTTKLPSEIMRNVLEITQKFKKFHWIIKVDKYSKDVFENAEGLSNVIVADWVPQPAILAHPRLKAFITHAGYNSLMESARAGIPVVSIPFMFDQPRNSRAVERKGWGVARDKKMLINEPEKIEQAVREILTNPIYTKKAQRLKKLMRTKPQTASERLVQTTNWVLKNNGVEELQYEGKLLDFVTYYNLDIIILLITIVISLLCMLRLSMFFNSSQKSKIE
ncbi:unnamed protein product [Caenorhabditis bovis]|uniref:UDP-glucuronosyltransferase n=1 Tax=Caenorhabditis bovis TaxID=2654633 RepID=A0A8S1E5R2_9PELO|nr:unnamed protein product [Caenorhabditis bovis]